MARLIFAGEHVGLIVRGKTSATHNPGVMEQHADCILSDGSCVGFFGEGRDGSSGSSGSAGLNMRGVVYDMDGLRQNRPYYIDGALARGYNVVSTVLSIFVGTSQAQAFDQAWASLAANPPSFWLAGANCSTRASGAFKTAGILSGGIPGLDTPDHLYDQLVATLGNVCSSHSGYVGFTPANNGYDVTIDAVTS